jgi:hypothetical protein
MYVPLPIVNFPLKPEFHAGSEVMCLCTPLGIQFGYPDLDFSDLKMTHLDSKERETIGFCTPAAEKGNGIKW